MNMPILDCEVQELSTSRTGESIENVDETTFVDKTMKNNMLIYGQLTTLFCACQMTRTT